MLLVAQLFNFSSAGLYTANRDAFRTLSSIRMELFAKIVNGNYFPKNLLDRVLNTPLDDQKKNKKKKKKTIREFVTF